MTSFAYGRDFPNPPDNPSNDVSTMQTNSRSIDSIIAVDHVGFNLVNGGIHKQVTMRNQNNPGLGSGQGVLFASLITGNSWPTWVNALGVPIPLISGPINAATNGYVPLAGGIFIQWGIANVNPSGALTTIPFTSSFQTQCFNVSITCIQSTNTSSPSENNVYLTTTPPSQSQFVVSNSSSGSVNKIYWIAIGN